jgi:hypothetical protein
VPNVVHSEVQLQPVGCQLPGARHDARVGNEHIESGEPRRERRREPTHRLERSEIELHHVQVLRVGLQRNLVERRFPLDDIATGDDYRRSQPREARDSCSADAAVAARDDAHLVFQSSLRSAYWDGPFGLQDPRTRSFG